MKLKMNGLLAKVDNASTVFKDQIKDYLKFFSGKQGAFLGERQTYEPKEGVVDDPTKRKDVKVQTTVREKLDYLKKQASDYFDNVMTVERTNASGIVVAPLIVDGELWGEFTSLELLRFKGFLEAQGLIGVMANLPVRSDTINWVPTTNPEYVDRDVYESPLVESTVRTTTKEYYILEDPNIAKMKDTSNYTPQQAVRNIVSDLGEHTRQQFSGEINHVQRAKALEKRSKLYQAVVIALKTANEAEPIKSDLTYDKVHSYLFGHI